VFTSLLIANRGEIACRIMETARKMGIRTIAVYSDADAEARHVRMADEAVSIGPSEASKSYLDMARIMAAAKSSQAEAIHPGYGFLSENPDFAELCQQENIIFVGPSAKSMRAMALKDQAKKRMEKAGVPVTPGYHDDDQDEGVLAKAAADIGYPVLIKAVAGGGGRGMRKVEHADEFSAQLESARRESRSAFGDDKVLIEKFITNPRHVEVQVFGDSHGNAVHFYERDCSVQRRHQKVIEEAPAPGMTLAMRSAMCDAAIKATKAVDYENAGTVEFIVDGSGPLDPAKFWFMEMNTRLQVEHPVSEAITGYDLVALQLEIAAGGHLPKQQEIKLFGHAVEARIYAEQPEKDFLPSIGTLQTFDHISPLQARFDTGYEAGDVVSEFYDPMMAKLIVHRPDRAEAIDDLSEILQDLHCWPVRTNARFLVQILESPKFASGDHDTGFIEAHLEDFQNTSINPELLAAAFADCQSSEEPETSQGAPWQIMSGWRLNGPQTVSDRISVTGEAYRIETRTKDEERSIRVNDREIPAEEYFASSIAVETYPNGQQVLFVGGAAYEITKPDAEADNTALDALDVVSAPMPGKILDIRTKVGDKVIAGEVLLVMEAMKMEHALKAPRDGVVETVGFAVGEQVVEGAVLVSLQE
jgi:acetyl/propionyl-CoA carboxylase alpha subunit